MAPSLLEKRRQALTVLLKDPVQDVREAAARALENLEDAVALEEILLVLKKGGTSAKIKAIFALGKVGGEKVLSPLVYCASRPEEEIRSAAIEVLGELAHPKSLPVLFEGLNDSSTAVRGQAIAALRHFPLTAEIVKKIAPFLSSGDGFLDAEAILLLRKSRLTSLEPEYLRLLQSPHAKTREAAALAIGDLPVT